MTEQKLSRKERKRLADKKRHDITIKICEIIEEAMSKGASIEEGLLKAEQWVQWKINETPQEKSMYVTAVNTFVKGLRGQLKSKEG
jgi:hypothetical protein